MQKLYHKKYGVLTAKEKRYSPVGNTIITIWVDSKGIERELDGSEITLEEYEQQQRFLKEQEERTKKNQGFDENVREVFSHMKLVKGSKGDPGKDGYTPKAGVDYYTKKQIEVLIESIQDKTLKGTIQSLIEDIRPIKGKDYFDGKDGYTPQYGKDYFTKEDIQMFFSEITKKVQSKVRNGIDGKDGKKGKGVEFKWEGTKLYIKKEGEEWGEGKDLKGLDGLNGGGGGIHKIEDATDVSTKNVVIGNALVWNGSQWVPGEAGAVESVNGQTGVVVLDYEDVGAEPTKGEDDNYVTDAEKIVIGNTSGANTGDETQTTIKTKLGPATASADGYATATQITKLDGIEALADVTDATNVAGAGAVMDGDFSSNGLMERIGSGTYGVKTIVTESSTIAGNDNDTSVPTSAAVKDYADSVLGTANALVYKGVIDCSTNPNYPASSAGHLYIVSVAGKIGGASGVEVEVGDMAICNTDSTVSGNQATVGIYWNVIQKNIIGAVTGPASAVDDNIATFDSITGKVIQDSGTSITALTGVVSKVGSGVSTPTANKLLAGTGTGTSSWGIDIKDEDNMASDSASAVPTQQSVKAYVDNNSGGSGAVNVLSNGTFINNSTNGYGGTADDWTNSSANPVQGGIPALTKQNLIDILGISDGDIEGLWNLNEASGNAVDLSSNGYNLTDNNTVGSSDDGLMAKARDFEKDNSESLSIAGASCGNLDITGSQTWIAFVKPETLEGRVMSKHNGTQYRVMALNTTGKITQYFSGLTLNQLMSDVALATGKWGMIVGVYDSVSQKIKVFINGIKKEASSSGSSSANNGDFSIGKELSTEFFDGLIQNACILSVALTDNQVSRLFWETLGKKTKLRRATSDGYIYQSLPQNLVEQYKGKTLSVTAKVYQDTASIAQVSLYDGAETASSTSATTGSWIDIGATRTISATARQIDVRAKVSSSNGNAWFKEIQVYEGSSLVYEWSPSADDKARFPRLLKGENIDFVSGYRAEGDLAFNAGALTTTHIPKSGQLGYDSTNNRLYINQGGTVKYTAMT